MITEVFFYIGKLISHTCLSCQYLLITLLTFFYTFALENINNLWLTSSRILDPQLMGFICIIFLFLIKLNDILLTH